MAKSELTTLEYALLGLVSMGPMSGYDVHKVFATTPLAHFSSSPGAIYPALRRLERRGLLEAALDRAMETRPRRMFSLTSDGQAVLDAWLRQPVTREEIVSTAGAAILRFSLMGGHLSDTEVVAYLRGWRAELEAYVAELRARWTTAEAQAQMPLHARLALESGLRGFVCELEWTDYAIRQVRGRKQRTRR
jgi:DNA-binding PadR family transcriptional regulator